LRNGQTLLRPFAVSHAKYICTLIKTLQIFMPGESEKETSQSRKEISPISKPAVGAVVGAAIGSIAGPIGAIVGGVAGAVAGNATSKHRRVARGSKKTARKRRKEGERIDLKDPSHARQRQLEHLRRRSPLKATEQAGKSGVSILLPLVPFALAHRLDTYERVETRMEFCVAGIQR
jgi:hypothetical protein